MLVFDYRSTRRQCGALNIRPAPGQQVDGYLFAIQENGWAALNQKEGHPHRYRREVVTVVDAQSCTRAAQTYRVTPEHRRGFAPPSEDYLAVCRAGRAPLRPLQRAARTRRSRAGNLSPTILS